MKDGVLVYGFGPYANYSHNVTIDIIEQIQRLKLAPAVIFDTRFNRVMFENELKKHTPRLIIGLGQDSRARKIRLERRAVNWQKTPKKSGRRISKNGARYVYVPLKVAARPGTTIAYDAGDYVCNYSMYLMCEYCAKTCSKFAFLHVPITVNAADAALLVTEIIESVDS